MDFSIITAGLQADASPVIQALMAIAAVLVSVKAAEWGVREVLAIIRADDNLYEGEREDYAFCYSCGWNEYDDGWYDGQEDSGHCPQCDEEL